MVTRVAFLNRLTDYDGGDKYEIYCRMAALSKLGIYCEYNPVNLEEFDLLHIYHCNFDWSRPIYQRAKASGIPYVVTPMYYPVEFGMPKPEIVEYLRGAWALMPFSIAEAEELSIDLGFGREMDIIPNGTDEAFHCFSTLGRYGVCTAIARPQDRKNCDVIEQACKLAGLPFTLLCGVAHMLMPEAYAMHKIFVSLSDSERMSLVIGEALCAGCRVLATSANRGNSWYPGLVTVDPKISVEELEQKMLLANDQVYWDWIPNKAARELTWTVVTERALNVYNRVTQ